jgi:hypothetical protein
VASLATVSAVCVLSFFCPDKAITLAFFLPLVIAMKGSQHIVNSLFFFPEPAADILLFIFITEK